MLFLSEVNIVDRGCDMELMISFCDISSVDVTINIMKIRHWKSLSIVKTVMIMNVQYSRNIFMDF